MGWVRNSLYLARGFSASLSVSLAVSTMVFSPLAQGAQAKKQSEEAAQLPAESASRDVASVGPRLPDISKLDMNFKLDKKFFQDYFKATGYGPGKKITVGEFYSKLRPMLPKTFKKDADLWATLNRNSLMPDVQMSTYKGSEGKEQIRLLLTMPDKKTVTLSFDDGSEGKYLKFNNVNLSKKDLLYYEQGLRKIAHGDKDVMASVQKGRVDRVHDPVKLSYAEFKRFTAEQRVEYLIGLRKLVESAQSATKAFHPKTAMTEDQKMYEYVIRIFLGESVFAGVAEGQLPNPEERCHINGYFSVYGEGRSCGGGSIGKANLAKVVRPEDQAACSSNQVPCNPLVYAYKNNGKPYCVNNVREDILFATSQACPEASPLRTRTPDEVQRGDKKRLAEEIADKKRLIQSYLAKRNKTRVDLKFDDQGRLNPDDYSPEQWEMVTNYVEELNAYVDVAIKKCNTMPLSAIKERMIDQKTACEAIATRKIHLETISIMPPPPVVVVPEPVPPPPLPVGEVTCDHKPNSWPDNGECVCVGDFEEGPVDGHQAPACVAKASIIRDGQPEKCEREGEKRDKDGKCVGSMFSTRGLLIGAGILGIGALLFGLTKGKDKKPAPAKPQTPYDPCPPAPLACTGQPPAPVTPPATQMPPPIIVAVPAPVPTTTPAPTPVTVVTNPPIVDLPVPERVDLVPASSAGGVRTVR